MTKKGNNFGLSLTLTRRQALSGAATTAAGLFLSSHGALANSMMSAGLRDVHQMAAKSAAELAAGRAVNLTIMYPDGSLGNVEPVAKKFTQETGISIEFMKVPLGDINEEILLDAESNDGTFDISLPATFGMPDLIEAGALVNLDPFASKYEPADFQEDALFSIGDYYKGSLYGYQTDGDTYLMFYNKPWLENGEFQKAFSDQHGYELGIPDTWEQLDAMMAFFNRPDEGKHGGALFRNEFFIAWEWWVRFHAKGYFPLADDLTPQINNAAGVAALEELMAATKSLYPNARSNGLFENWQAFAKGDTFCNIGWGGTQKFLNGKQSAIKDNLAFGPTPGGVVNGQLIKTPYFNWGWNYVVSNNSVEKEIAYLFCLYACSPELSTVAVRDEGGYFDPFRGGHYQDPDIRKTYGQDFLKAHEASMRDSIPDLYLKGQGEYFDELRVNLSAADMGAKTPQQAMDDTADAWNRITDRMGKRSQKVQWDFLKSTYPAGIRNILT